jgi:hypothetical protein
MVGFSAELFFLALAQLELELLSMRRHGTPCPSFILDRSELSHPTGSNTKILPGHSVAFGCERSRSALSLGAAQKVWEAMDGRRWKIVPSGGTPCM